MMKATKASVDWDADKNQWHVRVQIGEEVIKRLLKETSADANEQALRTEAVDTAKDEGYEVDPATVAIVR